MFDPRLWSSGLAQNEKLSGLLKGSHKEKSEILTSSKVKATMLE